MCTVSNQRILAVMSILWPAVCVLLFRSLSKDIEPNLLLSESEGLTLIITCIDLCALEEKLLVPEQPTMNGY